MIEIVVSIVVIVGGLLLSSIFIYYRKMRAALLTVVAMVGISLAWHSLDISESKNIPIDSQKAAVVDSREYPIGKIDPSIQKTRIPLEYYDTVNDQYGIYLFNTVALMNSVNNMEDGKSEVLSITYSTGDISYQEDITVQKNANGIELFQVSDSGELTLFEACSVATCSQNKPTVREVENKFN